ncbi:nephrin-like [Amphibalanus amphitrite]|uniref:nephrin-like n=1 Tax=Amphibalanus amphitrite TaxID=1232801 RepID=UPI001C91E02C|nr:nephrin-like [Amphibalanus amphitrite]
MLVVWSQPMPVLLVLLLMLSAGCSLAITRGGRVTHVSGVAGHGVDLPCDIDTAEPQDQAVLVLWYKNRSGKPTYTFDARGGRSFSDRDGRGGARATFVTHGRSAVLRLDHLEPADEAVYRCRVDFTLSPTRNQRVNLTVIIPPERPVIIFNSRPVSGRVGPLQEGDRLELTCLARGGRPPPRVTWFRDGRLLDDTDSGDQGSGQVTNVLRLPPLGRDDLHSSLVCSAANNNISSPATNDVIIDINFRPMSVAILGSAKSSLQAGSSYSLVCRAYGSRPPAMLSWWLGEVLLDGALTETEQGNISSSTLMFTPRASDNERNLSCRAENRHVTGGTMKDTRKLNVRFRPKVSARLGSILDPEDIKEGTNVYFECSITANPAAYSVSWLHNDQAVVPSPRAGVGDIISINGDTLVIRNLTRRSAGRYVCRAVNPEGEGVSRPVSLTVRYAPVCISGQKIQYGTSRNEPAQVTCQVDANPADVTFRWQFNTSIETLDLPFSQITSRGLESSAAYTPKTELDYGMLLCTADNAIGRMVRPCVFHIVPAGPPDPVHNCSVVNQTSESLRVACSAGFDGGLPQRFSAELYDATSGRLERNLSAGRPEFEAERLPAGVELRVRLYAFNARGRSRPTTLDGFTLKAAEKRVSSSTVEMPPEDSVSVTPILGVLIGVVASLIIIAIGVVACMRNNSRRAAKPPNPADLVHSSLMIKDGTDATGDAEYRVAPATSPDSVKHIAADDTNPDVVPNKFDPEYEVAESTLLLNHVNVGMGGRNSLLLPTVRPPHAAAPAGRDTPYAQEGVTYAELTLPRPGEMSRANRSRDRVIYATIDHGRAPGGARDTVVRTAPASDQRESVV